MELDVWLGNQLVANVRERRRKFYVDYTDEAASRYGPEVPLLSCSLPTPGPTPTPGLGPCPTDHTRAFLEGLLPEGAAVAIAPTDSGWSPEPGRYDPVDEAGLERLVADLPTNPLGANPREGRRMSPAGAQPKLVLAHFDGRWYEPADGAASTHILKPTRS